MKLTIKQKKFADEYIISGNAYQAAISAGYSENYAKNASFKMVENNRQISDYISQRLKELESNKIATQEEVLQFFTRVMREEETEKVLRYSSQGVQELIEVPASMKDKIRAAENLNKLYEVTNINVTSQEDNLSDLFNDLRSDLND